MTQRLDGERHRLGEYTGESKRNIQDPLMPTGRVRARELSAQAQFLFSRLAGTHQARAPTSKLSARHICTPRYARTCTNGKHRKNYEKISTVAGRLPPRFTAEARVLGVLRNRGGKRSSGFPVDITNVAPRCSVIDWSSRRQLLMLTPNPGIFGRWYFI